MSGTLKFILFLALTITPIAPAWAQVADKPNIVIIYADDIGYGDLGCYGGEIPTPNIDKLAQGGLKFTDGYCPSATCTPSRFSMLTGQYPFRQKGTGIARGDAAMIIKPGTVTMATIMKDAGYTTGVVGKWHLGLGAGGEARRGPAGAGGRDLRGPSPPRRRDRRQPAGDRR